MSPHPLTFEDLFASSTKGPEAPFTGYAPFNFIGGHNDPMEIPIDGLVEAATTGLPKHGRKMAMYNLGLGPMGLPDLRAFVAEKLRSARGMACGVEDVLITSGSGWSLDIVNRLLVGPGDTVLIEEYSYPGAIGKPVNLGAEVIGMAMDDEGIRVDLLEEQLLRLQDRNVTPKYIYTIPTIQNPTGGILGMARRERLVALSDRFGVPIFEDECYADLIWAQEAPPPSLHAMAPGNVIHIGSFSKCLAPAVRLGYAVANGAVIERMLALKTDGGTGALDQIIVSEFCSRHFDTHMARMSEALQRKLDTMIGALTVEFGTAVEFRRPPGGIFLWLKFPDHIDVRAIEAAAQEAGVAFNPGPDWACDGEKAKNLMRLCFANPSEEVIVEGIARLAQVCFETFGLPRRGANRDRSAGSPFSHREASHD